MDRIADKKTRMEAVLRFLALHPDSTVGEVHQWARRFMSRKDNLRDGNTRSVLVAADREGLVIRGQRTIQVMRALVCGVGRKTSMVVQTFRLSTKGKEFVEGVDSPEKFYYIEPGQTEEGP